VAQSGFTPIQLYYSITASNVPSASNLALGELAINIADGKLYYNSSGTIKLIAANLLPIANGGTFSTTIPTAGAIAYGDGSAYQFTAAGTTGQLLTSAGAGIPTWSNIADIAVTSLNFGTTGLTPATATKGDITVAGTLAVANGGTGLTSTPANGALDIGNGTGFTRSTLTAGSGVSITNGSGSISISATGLGGTVTSVGLSLPSIFTVTGSPVTTSGTLTATLATETANYVFAGPTTGAAAIPTFRALVAADIPSLSYVTSVSFTGGIITVATPTSTPAFTVAGTSGGIPYFSSGTTWASSAALTQYGVVYGGGAGGAPVSTAAGTTGQVLTATTGGAPTWAAPATSGTVTSVSVVSANGFAGTVATATSTPAITLTTSVTGVLKGNGTAISAATANTDYQGVSAPVTKTADFTVAATDIWLINNKSGSTCTVTLPTASSWSGRVLRFLNYQAQTVVSASSNVVPLTGGAAATSILLASTGDSVTLVSDGSNWLMTQYIPNNILLLE